MPSLGISGGGAAQPLAGSLRGWPAAPSWRFLLLRMIYLKRICTHFGVSHVEWLFVVVMFFYAYGWERKQQQPQIIATNLFCILLWHLQSPLLFCCCFLLIINDMLCRREWQFLYSFRNTLATNKMHDFCYQPTAGFAVTNQRIRLLQRCDTYKWVWTAAESTHAHVYLLRVVKQIIILIYFFFCNKSVPKNKFPLVCIYACFSHFNSVIYKNSLKI